MKVDLHERVAGDLSRVNKRLERAYKSAAKANQLVDELEKQQNALQTALDIMEGKQVPAPEPQAAPDFGFPGKGGVTWAPTAAPPPGEQVTLNGEPIVLEPGWRIGKNSFGEEVLLAPGQPDPAPMEEPTRPTAPLSILPPIGENEGFAPDLPGGEI